MPLWIKITIVAVLGVALSITAYQFVDYKLDEEHERYVQSLVIEYSTDTSDITESEKSPSEAAASSTDTDTVANPFDLLLFSGDSTSNFLTDSSGMVRLERSSLSIEIGIIAFDQVKFEVGESWTDETGQEVYTITKIIQTPKQVQLYYETKDGTEYVFILDQDDDGDYEIQGAEEEIIIEVDTDPEDTDPDPETDDTSTTTDDGADDDPDPTPDTDPDPTPDPDDSDPDPEEEETPTSTEPVIDTTPTTTDNGQNQPYSDGTYQYKTNPQYVPYTPPLYDRDYGEEISVDS